MSAIICAEIWGCLANPASAGGYPPACKEDQRTTLIDQAGQTWGFVCARGGGGGDTAGVWTLPSGDATVSWCDGQLSFSRLARGMHTIYYRLDQDGLHFASRLPRLLAGLPAASRCFEWRSLSDVLAVGRVLPPLTTFKGIFHIEPGSRLLWKAEKLGLPTAYLPSNADTEADGTPRNVPGTAAICLFGPDKRGYGSAVRRALGVASKVELFDHLALATSVLGQPVGGMVEAAVSALLTAGHISSSSFWDVDADLRAEAEPADDVNLMRLVARGRWRRRLLEYWLDERRPRLLEHASSRQSIPAWRIAAERRLHLVALTQPHDFLPGFAAVHQVGSDSAIITPACFWSGVPQLGHLLANAVDLHRNRAAAGDFIWRDALHLSQLHVSVFARSKTPGLAFRFYEAIAAILSMQYLSRFAAVLPLPSLRVPKQGRGCT